MEYCLNIEFCLKTYFFRLDYSYALLITLILSFKYQHILIESPDFQVTIIEFLRLVNRTYLLQESSCKVLNGQYKYYRSKLT